MAATTKSGRRVDLIDRYADLMHTPEFTIMYDGLFGLEVCTSLSDGDAQDRANLIPPREGWVWELDPALTLPCSHTAAAVDPEKPVVDWHVTLKAVRCG